MFTMKLHWNVSKVLKSHLNVLDVIENTSVHIICTKKIPIIQTILLKTENYSDFSNSEEVFWMHCRTKFSFTLVWNVWYIGYEVWLDNDIILFSNRRFTLICFDKYDFQVLLKAIPTFLITTLNILMFLKLQNIWKQRREFKKTMQAEAIPIIATPVMNHKTLSIKSKDTTSANCNDDVNQQLRFRWKGR